MVDAALKIASTIYKHIKKLRQLSVKQRIVVIFIIFILIPSIAFLTVTIRSYSQYALNSILNEKYSIMEQMNKNIAYQFEKYEDLTMTLYHNEQTRSYIDSEDYSEYSVVNAGLFLTESPVKN